MITKKAAIRKLNDAENSMEILKLLDQFKSSSNSSLDAGKPAEQPDVTVEELV